MVRAYSAPIFPPLPLGRCPRLLWDRAFGAVRVSSRGLLGKTNRTLMETIPARELWIHQNPVAMAMLVEGLAALGRGETGVPIDLTQFPGDDEV